MPGQLSVSSWTQVAISMGGGILIGLGSVALYAGGALRQNDINTSDIAIIKSGGSPPVVALKGAVDTLALRLDRDEHDIHDMPTALAALRETDASTAVRLKYYEQQIHDLQGRLDRSEQDKSTLIQRIATMEAQFDRLDKQESKLRDQFDASREHQRTTPP